VVRGGVPRGVSSRAWPGISPGLGGRRARGTRQVSAVPGDPRGKPEGDVPLKTKAGTAPDRGGGAATYPLAYFMAAKYIFAAGSAPRPAKAPAHGAGPALARRSLARPCSVPGEEVQTSSWGSSKVVIPGLPRDLLPLRAGPRNPPGRGQTLNGSHRLPRAVGSPHGTLGSRPRVTPSSSRQKPCLRRAGGRRSALPATVLYGGHVHPSGPLRAADSQSAGPRGRSGAGTAVAARP
jgi:hypothetical protein